jgi:hypothetical protein
VDSVILCVLPDTGERYPTAPLFEGIEAEMSEEELTLSRSTPSVQFPPARRSARRCEWRSFEVCRDAQPEPETG